MSLSHSEVIQLDVPASYYYLRLVSICIEELLTRMDNLSDRDILTYNIQLATHEVCTNIIDHAYAGNPQGRIMMTFKLTPQPAQIVIHLRDTGDTFDFQSIPDPDLDEVREHGYGLFLIRSLMDQVTYNSAPNQNHWELVKYLA